MNKKFFEATVKYDRLIETGEPARVTEQYFIQGQDCTDIETKMLAEITPLSTGLPAEVVSIKQSKYIEFIPENVLISNVTGIVSGVIEMNMDKQPKKYYGAKLSFITLDEVKNKEKKTAVNYLIHATSVEAAHKTLVFHMRDSQSDYQVNNIVETKIVDTILEKEQ